MQTSEFEKQATELLAKFGVHFVAELIGNDCPRFCDDALADRDMDKLETFPRKTHIHGKHYRCFLNRQATTKTVCFDFWNSYADEEFNALGTQAHRLGETLLKYDRKGKRTVSAYDLLSCLQKDDPGTFEQFCGDFGYDTDSRRAEQTYQAVRDEWRKVQSFFTAEELQALQEVQ